MAGRSQRSEGHIWRTLSQWAAKQLGENISAATGCSYLENSHASSADKTNHALGCTEYISLQYNLLKHT